MCIYKKLIEIQSKLKVPRAQYNSFGNYYYRSGEDIVEAVKKILPEDTLLLLSDDLVLIGERYYVRATAALVDKNGKIEAHGFAREPLAKKGMDESQITGTASSYARKYALNGLFALDDTKDADTEEHTKQTQTINKEPRAFKKQLTPEQEKSRATVKEIVAEIGRCVLSEEVSDTLHLNIDKISKLSEEQQKFINKKAQERLDAIAASMNGGVPEGAALHP